MNLMKTLFASAAIAVTAGAASASVIFATEVIDVNRGDIHEVVDGRDDVNNALGKADNVFYSMGVGGDITLGFGALATGDVSVWEVTFGEISEHVEIVDVYAIFEGTETKVGSVSNDVSQKGFALTFSGVFDALKLVDVSPLDGGTKDGFDLDAVSVQKVPVPASALLLLGGIAGLGDFLGGVGHLEIVFGQAHRPGGHPRSATPFIEMLFVVHVVAFDAVIGARGPRHLGVKRHLIGEHQRVIAHLVPPVPRDAEPLHQSSVEFRVAFAVLHVVFDRGVVVGQLVFHMRAAHAGIGLQHVGQDLDHGHVVKDALVAAQPGNVQPGPQRDIVAVAVFLAAAPLRGRRDAVKVALPARDLEFARGVGAQQGVQIKPRLIRKH